MRILLLATAAILLTTGSAATADTIVGVGGALIALAGGSLPVKLYLDRQDEIREIRSFASDWRRLEDDLERQERCDWMCWFRLTTGRRCSIGASRRSRPPHHRRSSTSTSR